jgi:glycerol kinase
MGKYVLVIDEGTTGTRALVFDKKLSIVSESYVEFTQYTPADDRVEHDAEEIYTKSIDMCKKALEKAGITAAEVDCLGITNQRATSVVWDKKTGKPLYNAIVWQDSRTGARCNELNASEWGAKCKKKTGWTIATVYSSLSIEWMMKNVPGVKEKLESGDALFGTIDSWLIWNLTGGKTHAISYSNASVTGSLDLWTGKWYEEFLAYLGIPVSIYPSLVEDSGDFGTTEIFGAPIPITGVIADQHAALYAQGCVKEGTAKLTNGTGSFLDVNIGEECFVVEGGTNTVIAWKIKDRTYYAVEGYAGVTGSAVQWLRDNLGIIGSSPESETLARSVPDSGGIYFVPALTGLGAPYWEPFARGLLIGINRGTNKAHLCRAVLESIAYSVKDIIVDITNSTGKAITDVSIDGGASQNNLLSQMLADILKVNINRPGSIEATSQGAAMMAGLYTGYYTEADFEGAVETDKFSSQISDETRDANYKQWLKAIERSKYWLD